MVQKLGLALSLPTIKTVAASDLENLYSLDFDGSNDYVDFGSGSTFTPNSSGSNRGFSISCWIKTSFSRITLMNKYNGGYHEYMLKVDTGGAIAFELYADDDGAIKQILTTDTSAGSFIDVSDGSWHHVVCTFNLSGHANSQTIWIDGVEFDDANGGANYTSAGTWTNVINTAASFRFASDNRGYKGLLDEVSMWDDELGSSEVAAIYNSGTPTDLTGEGNLIGWWRNGDPTGTGAFPTIVDQSTNSNDGTMTNMASGDIVTDVP